MAKRGPMTEEEKKALAERLQNGRKHGRGKSTKPSRTKAMLAKCYECMAGYVDGKEDCECVKCPLYPWMPYAKLDANLAWLDINTKRKAVEDAVDEEDDEDDDE